MKSILGVSCTAITQLINSCSGGLQSFSKLESETALTNYKTYAWITPSDPEGNPREDDNVLASLIQDGPRHI